MVPRRWVAAGGVAGAALAVVGGHSALTVFKVIDATAEARKGGGDQSRLDELAMEHNWLFLDAGLLFALAVGTLSLLLLVIARSRRTAGSGVPEPASGDELAALPNREDFTAALRNSLGKAGAEPGRGLTILMVSLNGITDVVRAHGASAFDQLLLAAFRRLRRVIRDDDEVACVADEDFGVLLHGITDLRGVEAVTDRIEESFGRPFRLQTGIASIRANIGIAICGPDADAEDALRRAESAMYRARAAGGGVALADGGLAPATEHLSPISPRKHLPGRDQAGVAAAETVPTPVTPQIDFAGDLKGLLRESGTDGPPRLEYEPIVQIPEIAVTGVAAAVCWRHPIHGLVPRSELFAIAQTSGLVTALAAHLINQAASDAAKWQAAGSPLVVSLPLSAGCLSDPWFVPAIQAALEQVNLDPQLLLLEFPESGVLAQPELTTPALVAIRRLGAGIAVSDFGVASVSLAQLGRVPVDEFKIDCRILAGPGPGPGSGTGARTGTGTVGISGTSTSGSGVDLIREAVGTAHTLGAAAVGYGVSTALAVTRAEQCGFDRLHGPAFGEPVTRDGVPLACERAFDRASRGRRTGRTAGPRHGRLEGYDTP